MKEFEFVEESIPVFNTVGELRELLKDYTDDVPLRICGVPGLFFPNPANECVRLEVQDSGGYEAISEIMEAVCEQEYMDF